MTPPTAFSETPGHGTGEAHTLVSLLSRQRDHYQQLKALSDAQQELIATGKAEQLLTVLAERQGHVEALTTLNEQLAPLRSRMTEISESAEDDIRQRLRGLVDEVQGLLESIIHQDEQDKQTLSEGKEKIKQQLNATARVPAALSAYKVASPTNGARFTDRQG